VTGATPGFGAVLSGLVLAAAFGLLYQRRAGGLINACALQAWALAAAAAWQVEELHTEEGRLDEVFRSITLPETARPAK